MAIVGAAISKVLIPFVILPDGRRRRARRPVRRRQGMAAPLTGVTPMYAICFLGYRIGQDLQRSSPDQTVRCLKTAAAGLVRAPLTALARCPLAAATSCHLGTAAHDQPTRLGRRSLGRLHDRDHGARRPHQGAAPDPGRLQQALQRPD